MINLGGKINKAQLKVAKQDYQNRLEPILEDHDLLPNNKQLALSLVGFTKLIKELRVCLEYGAGLGKSRLALNVGLLIAGSELASQ